jgi:hypothetical protein
MVVPILKVPRPANAELVINHRIYCCIYVDITKCICRHSRIL